MNTRVAEQIADAVLYEGYVLYPYRASAAKNRLRWQVGLVTPRAFAEATSADPWFIQTECLVEATAHTTLALRVRGLHIQERTIEEAAGDPPVWRAVERTTIGDRTLLQWDEAAPREFVRERLALEFGEAETSWVWTLAADRTAEEVRAEDGRAAARIVRTRQEVACRVTLSTQPAGRFLKLRLRVENLTACPQRSLAERNQVLRRSLAGTHAILEVRHGAFVSLLEPPPDAEAHAAGCVNLNTYPVLAGEHGARDVVLSSPIILYDYPAVAPESLAEFCDGTEIDEMLTLRVRTLTDDEKQEARATDRRAAQIIDRCDAARPETLAQLHGAVRSFESLLNPAGEPPPERAFVDVRGVRLQSGSAVRLEPVRALDSMDLCLRGRTGTVAAVYRTIEDDPFIAVTLDDDPFGAAGAKYRRQLFFRPDDLVPLDEDRS